MRTWLARAAREWPWGIAIAAVLSLLFIPRVVRFGAFVPEDLRRDLESLRHDVEEGDPVSAELRLAAFLARHPRTPLRADAELLLARATVARGRSGSDPGADGLSRAWAILLKAPRTPDFRSLLQEVALEMEEYGLVREAVDRLSFLYAESKDPQLALHLARALALRAGLEPESRVSLLDDASARVSDALRVLPADRRLPALRIQARIFREARRDEDMLARFSNELTETRTPADRGLVQLERGRLFARLGRNMEALSAFDEAEKLLTDPLLRGMAQVHQAELFFRAENPEGLELCKRVQASESPAAPFATVLLGAAQLKSRSGAGLDTMRSGLEQIRRPRLLEEAGFETTWPQTALRSALDRESDPDRLLSGARVYGELVRLHPLSTRLGFDHGAVLLRARRFEEAANRFLATGASGRADAETKERAVLAAADACAEGGLYRRAASLYREYYDLRPAANSVGLFHRASSLRKAGDTVGAMAGFEEYLSRTGPSGSFAGPALLEKAALQSADGDWAAALATYDRVIRAREVATSPEKEDWALALLGRGRALLRLSRPAEARKALEEYLERYAEGSAPAPASVEAAWLLVRAAIDERQWKTGLERLRTMEQLAARLPEADRAPYRDRLEEASCVEGDLLFNLGDYPAACRAYGVAARRLSGTEDRLRGLIGSARALARLERIEEARKDYTKALVIFDEDRDTSYGIRGREYWEIELQSLAKEVR